MQRERGRKEDSEEWGGRVGEVEREGERGRVGGRGEEGWERGGRVGEGKSVGEGRKGGRWESERTA